MLENPTTNPNAVIVHMPCLESKTDILIVSNRVLCFLISFTHKNKTYNFGILNFYTCVSKAFFQRFQCSVDIISRRIGNTDTHVAESYILRCDFLMQTSSEDHPFLEHIGQDVGWFKAFW